MERGELLFKHMFLKIYENGLKPSTLAYLYPYFITFDKLVKIYPLYTDRDKVYGDFMFVYLGTDKTDLENCSSVGGIKGHRFTIRFTEYEFRQVKEILKERLKDRFNEVYDPDIGLKAEIVGKFINKGWNIYNRKTKKKL